MEEYITSYLSQIGLFLVTHRGIAGNINFYFSLILEIHKYVVTFSEIKIAIKLSPVD